MAEPKTLTLAREQAIEHVSRLRDCFRELGIVNAGIKEESGGYVIGVQFGSEKEASDFPQWLGRFVMDGTLPPEFLNMPIRNLKPASQHIHPQPL